MDADDPCFLPPGGMPERIREYCRGTSQSVPESPGQVIRVALEAVALKTRIVLEQLERVSGRRIAVIHMVGGGARNRLLCQLTADACGRPVQAGPVEATATGNILTQAMAVGAVGSLAEARKAIAASFEMDRYEPRPSAAWDDACGRLKELLRGNET
jgi:rhamnulokinase